LGDRGEGETNVVEVIFDVVSEKALDLGRRLCLDGEVGCCLLSIEEYTFVESLEERVMRICRAKGAGESRRRPKS
jgi:hypothetical protein